MKTIVVFLADGFEECEALIVVASSVGRASM